MNKKFIIGFLFVFILICGKMLNSQEMAKKKPASHLWCRLRI
jgi:hypothetical protein